MNVPDAEANLSKLIERAVAGGEAIIAKTGTPMVRPVPVDPPGKRIFGSQISFKRGWDAPMTKRESDEFIGD